MDPTPVMIQLTNIHCSDEGDSIGSAEPYLWTVFFKIDGDTTHVDDTLTLQGTATVVTTPGNHGDLGPGGVNAGDDIMIPLELGQFSTVLTPIPIDSGGAVPGVVGCAVILMEQDDTPDHAVDKGHEALNQALQSALDGLIPTLNFQHPSPTKQEIDALSAKVGQQVSDTISNDVSIWEWLKGFGNEDDQIGSAVFYKSHDDICSALYAGIPLSADWENEGSWQLTGSINAVIDDVEISCIHKPSGNFEAHHIDRLGGTFNGQTWRLTNIDVIRYIQAGEKFHVVGADGSRSQVEVGKHWVSTANPTGLFLTTSPDGSKSDNLLSLPTCAPLSG